MLLECCLCLALIAFVVTCIKWHLESLRIADYRDKTVVITGCDSGFGTEIALRFLAHGITVYAGCLTDEGQRRLRHSSRLLPGKLITLPLDVTDELSVTNASQLVEKELENNGLHALLNNAGIMGAPGPDDFINAAHYQQALDVNTLGVIRVTHAFKRLIKRAKVTVTSIAGRIPFVIAPPYCASKYATEAYCGILRQELRQFGVSVHILEPGFFATEILDAKRIADRFTSIWQSLQPETRLEYGDRYYERMRDEIPKHITLGASRSVHMVTDAYFHAVTARFPRLRYFVGYDAMFVFRPLSLLPTAVQDFFLYTVGRFIFKMPLPHTVEMENENMSGSVNYK